MSTFTITLGALLPVFVLILAGWAIRRRQFLPDSFWPSAERLTYYVLFPALLVRSVAGADLTGLPVGRMAVALVLALLLMAALLLALRPRLGIDGPAFTSVVQGSLRWNTYVALAATVALFPPEALSAGAICIAVIVPTVNILSVLSFVRYAGRRAPGWRGWVMPLATNPLILASLGGLVLNVTGIGVPPGTDDMLAILGGAALPLGLLAVGAGLDFASFRHAGRTVAATTLLKLLVMPGLVGASFWLFGIGGLPALVAVLYMAMPTAPASYILARQLGGDARLMAAILTAQTALAVASLPLAVSLQQTLGH